MDYSICSLKILIYHTQFILTKMLSKKSYLVSAGLCTHSKLPNTYDVVFPRREPHQADASDIPCQLQRSTTPLPLPA